MLERGQVVACKVAFDGAQPKDLEGEEREAAREMFGDLDEIAPSCSTCSFLSSGAAAARRAGRHSPPLPGPVRRPQRPGAWPGGQVLGDRPELDLASEAMITSWGALEADPDLAPLLVNPKAGVKFERLVIKRPDGKLVAFEAKAAKRMGVTERGRP